MDHLPLNERDAGFDLESGRNEDEKLAKTFFTKLCDQFTSIDESSVKSDVKSLNCNEGSLQNNIKSFMDMKIEVEAVENLTGKEKCRKASSAKKPPRPPRPHRGFSLDACDQKLIKELAELAIIKRARIERMKALKQKKSLKGSSSSSNGSLFAMLFTVIFFLVILLQGRNSGATFQDTRQLAETNENGLILIQDQLNPSASDSVSPNSKSSKPS